MAQPAPSGSWVSPISSTLVTGGRISFQELRLDGQDVYWVELRPSGNGRYVLVKATSDGGVDVTPAGYSVNNEVNSYGGGSCVVSGGTVFFANLADQRVYRQDRAAAPRPITDQSTCCYADFVVDANRQRLICVGEDGAKLFHGQPTQTLVAIPQAAGTEQALCSGNDFYAAPRLSPDGRQLCWLTWDYPSMPWDSTQLWVADIAADGGLANARQVAGGPDESVFQPEWSPDGSLYFIGDRTGWWNLYRYVGGQVSPVCARPNDFGVPQWYLGLAQYDFASADLIVCTYVDRGQFKLATVQPSTGRLIDLATGLTDVGHVRATVQRAVCIGGAPDTAQAVFEVDLASGAKRLLRSSAPDLVKLDPYFSRPEPIAFPTSDGQSAYAFYYPPTNQDYVLPAGEKPLLVLKNHGGPTAAASTALDLELQYFTSRGFAVVDVNYRGSSGYGRAYRLSLYGRDTSACGNWGLYDVQDCQAVLSYLVGQGLADPARVVARGASAGGYTTMAVSAFCDPPLIRAGASYDGISNLIMIEENTDKLEAHYLDRLIGPYPQAQQTYKDRSPFFHPDRIKTPLLLFQGLKDPIVPPDQAKVMVETLVKHGVPVAVAYFFNEGHHLRSADHQQSALETELYFYAQILGFQPADALCPFPIYNWPLST